MTTKIPDPKEAQRLKKSFEEQKQISANIEEKRLQKESHIQKLAKTKAKSILKIAFNAALKGETFIPIELNEADEVDIELEKILTSANLLLTPINETIAEIEEEISIEAKRRLNGDYYTRFSNALHSIRMQLYKNIFQEIVGSKNAESIASAILPIIFNPLKPQTSSTNWKEINDTLKGWLRMFSYENTVINQNKVHLSSLASSYNESRHIASITNLEVAPAIAKLVKEAIQAIPDLDRIHIESTKQSELLDKLNNIPSATHLLEWLGEDWYEGPPPSRIDGPFLNWLSSSDGQFALGQLTKLIESEASNGKESILIEDSFISDNTYLLPQQFLFTLMHELGFGVSHERNRFKISWA